MHRHGPLLTKLGVIAFSLYFPVTELQPKEQTSSNWATKQTQAIMWHETDPNKSIVSRPQNLVNVD